MIHKIKALHDNGAGLSIRAIARELGISRNTVRKYLRMDEIIKAFNERWFQGWDATLEEQRVKFINIAKHVMDAPSYET